MAAASPDFQFAAAVASFGMLLRDSQHKGTATYDAVAGIAESAGVDVHGYRMELVEMVRRGSRSPAAERASISTANPLPNVPSLLPLFGQHLQNPRQTGRLAS